MIRPLLISLLMALPLLTGAQTPDSVSSGAGKFVFVPDSMAQKVADVLAGRSVETQLEPKLELGDKVAFRGDTLDVVIRQRNLGRYDRGLFNYLFVPKGIWSFGLTASYGEFSSNDLQLLDIVGDVDFSGHTFSIKPSVSYFIGNNVSVGLRLGYNSSKASLGRFAIDIDEDLNFDISDVAYTRESYTAALVLRQYVGLARRTRFGIFNEAELAFSSGNGDFRRLYDGTPKETHSTFMDARLTFSPGLCVFIMKNVAFNVSFGVFGFYVHSEHQNTDGVDSGRRVTSGANFKFNIFNINFGVGVYI